MSLVAEGVNSQDYDKVKAGGHQLKGASGYAGAGRVHYTCYQMQHAHIAGDMMKMMAYYPMLVEYTIEMRRFALRYFADLQGKFIKQALTILNE